MAGQVGTPFILVFFGAYRANNALGIRKLVLSLSEMEKKDFLAASQYFDYVEYVVGVDGDSFFYFFVIGRDGNATNKAVAHFFGPFLGCNSHRYKLAIKYILAGLSEVITKVLKLMKKH